MRGKEILNKSGFNSIRITPAHAGKSPVGIIKLKSTQDHPRTCGEKDDTLDKDKKS